MLKPIRFALTLSLVGASLAVTSPLAAQGYGNDHRPPSQSQHYDTHQPQQYHRNEGGYDRNWNRGQRLDRAHRNQAYVVTNWRGAHLRNPGRGRHWIRTGNQYVLISIRSGIIYGVVLRRR